ncbi:MAG: DegT/DnrJ/EryC1/StrS family aminotransferase [Planktomarina sp.]
MAQTAKSLPDLHQAEPIPQAAQEALADLLQTGDFFRYTKATDAPVALLEADFAKHLGSRYAVAVASCSAALFLALKALGLKPGAKVLIPGFTFAAVPSAVVHADCTPVLVEVDHTYRVDLEDLAAKAVDADVIMISHMRGHTSNMTRIQEIADAHDIPVIEDAAHSLGTTWNGKNLGTLGKLGAFSFQSYKMLNAGEGGILVTDDPDLAAKAIIMSGAYEHNWRKHGGFDSALEDAISTWQNQLPLYNTRMSNVAAALIRPQINELNDRITRGRRNHDYVAEKLRDCPWIDVPHSLPEEERAPDSIQFNLTVQTDAEVDAFAAAAERNGLPVQIFGRSKNNARAFWNWGFMGDIPDLPQTRAMLMRACDLRLPTRLTLEDCDLVADLVLQTANDAFAGMGVAAE